LSFRLAAIAAGAAAAALAIPAAAGAATGKVVYAGVPACKATAKSADCRFFNARAKTLQNKYVTDVNDFFPHTIRVNAGDTVTFMPTGFHTVDFPQKGGGPVPLFSPTGQKVANAVDAAGAPFWFNGQDQLGFTPDLVTKQLFGKKATYNGTKRVDSGLPLANNPKPYAIRFAKAGTYTYFCDIHPGMKGTVRVLPKGRRVPSAAADTKVVKAQITRSLNAAKPLASVKPPANTFDVGEPARNGVEHFGFVPTSMTVPTGTTVTFRMPARSYEVHTATAGPGNPEQDRNSYLGQLAASLESPVVNPAALYPSEVPGTVGGLTPTLHGNGFWNSGALDAASATPLPNTSQVRFDAPGTYQFYCLIHPFMHATVNVQ
jgi:plastocyanin